MNNGNFETRNTGGSGYPNRLRFEWWLIGQDIAGNRWYRRNYYRSLG